MNPVISRRQFTKQISVCAAAATVGAPGLGAAGKTVPVVDSHLHCFAGKNDFRFPYHPAGPYQPEAPATPEHLLKCMAEGGVDYAVVVHPEPYQDDLRYLEHCLQAGNGKLKGVCLLFAGRDDTPKRLTGLVHRLPNRIVAVRIHAYTPERLPAWNKPEQLRRLWRIAGDLGLAVQLHLEPRYAPRFEPFIREFPRVTTSTSHYEMRAGSRSDGIGCRPRSSSSGRKNNLIFCGTHFVLSVMTDPGAASAAHPRPPRRPLRSCSDQGLAHRASFWQPHPALP
ncbi:MAG: hypothetical protein EXS31_11630 [Pedosphaera sp.]|nr:hypothetical protein [Pedosphaera sp.]